MSKTVVGLFSSAAAAQQVKQTLVADGYESNQITIHANDTSDYSTSASTAVTQSQGAMGSIGEKISNFFGSLTGGDEHVRGHYTSGVNAGGALLSVDVEDAEAADVAALLREHGARDIDGAYEGATASGTPAYGSNTQNLTGATAIPIVEEELVVGKREVDRGGVRIYSRVVEHPVEADVTLRNERVNVERRPVDRPATEADLAAGAESSIEVRASGEEAVVGKSSRVVEEVVVGKQASEHTEAVRDTVRKTEVEVENIASDATGSLRK